MGLVDDEMCVGGQDAAIRGQVGQQQRMVDDDDMRRFGLARCLQIEVGVGQTVGGALRPAAALERARAAVGTEAPPDSLSRCC